MGTWVNRLGEKSYQNQINTFGAEMAEIVKRREVLGISLFPLFTFVTVTSPVGTVTPEFPLKQIPSPHFCHSQAYIQANPNDPSLEFDCMNMMLKYYKAEFVARIMEGLFLFGLEGRQQTRTKQ